MLIQLNLTEELNKKIKVAKVELDKSNLQDTIIFILEKHFQK